MTLTIRRLGLGLAGFAAFWFIAGALVGVVWTWSETANQVSEARAAQRQASDDLDTASERLCEAQRLADLCETVTRAWYETSTWYQTAYLRRCQ